MLTHGELVVDVPATLSSRTRLLGSGRSNKSDANDARAVAVAALRAPSLAVVRVEDHVSVLRLLAKAQFDISHARSRACSRLHALVNELVAGGIGKEVVVNHGQQLLATIQPVNAVQRQRLDLAHELLDEISLLDARRKASRRRIAEAVTASGTSLTEILGVGPIVAAIVIGYTGEIARFPSSGHYAAYNGTASVEFSSSGRTVHRPFAPRQPPAESLPDRLRRPGASAWESLNVLRRRSVPDRRLPGSAAGSPPVRGRAICRD